MKASMSPSPPTAAKSAVQETPSNPQAVATTRGTRGAAGSARQSVKAAPRMLDWTSNPRVAIMGVTSPSTIRMRFQRTVVASQHTAKRGSRRTMS